MHPKTGLSGSETGQEAPIPDDDDSTSTIMTQLHAFATCAKEHTSHAACRG